MAVTVETAATDTLLANKDELKEELGITDDSYDVMLDRMIGEASKIAEDHCRRIFAKQGIEETVPGNGSTRLMLSRTPIIGTPSEILYESLSITDFSVEDADAGILYRRYGWYWTRVLGWKIEKYYREDLPLFVVTYNAGYWLPNWETWDGAAKTADDIDLPGSVKRAVMEMVKLIWEKRSYGKEKIGEKIGDYSVQYMPIGPELYSKTGGLPVNVAALLAPYVRVK